MIIVADKPKADAACKGVVKDLSFAVGSRLDRLK